jgi:hypothetical protein
MRSLTSTEIVQVWEMGQERPNWQRALLLLAPCLPDHRASELAALSLAQRNALLFKLRGLIVGANLQGLVRCPVCAAPLEFVATVAEFLERDAVPPAGELQVTVAGQTIPYRLPNSTDLAAAAHYLDLPEAAGTIFSRTVLGDHKTLPPELVAQVAEAVSDEIESSYPLTDPRVALMCAAGDHVWSASLDIASFLWSEIDRIAKRLLDEVQVLARAYGWREDDILTMSESRRRFYLGAIDA